MSYPHFLLFFLPSLSNFCRPALTTPFLFSFFFFFLSLLFYESFPPLSIVTLAEPPTQNFQNLLFTLSQKILLYQLSPSTSAPPHFSSFSALESPTISLKTPTYSTHFFTRWVAAPYKSHIAYPSRIHMDSGWVAINLQTGQSGSEKFSNFDRMILEE